MFKQYRALLRELFQECWNRKSYVMIVMIPIILFAVVFLAINDMLFKRNYGQTKVGLFVMAIALIWIGVFNSITSICGIRKRIKVDFFQGMKAFPFVIAHVTWQLFVCFIQAGISCGAFWVWQYFYCDTFPTEGLYAPIWAEYFAAIYISIFSADMLGLAVSTWAKDNEQAMKIMPFILVGQMVFSNTLFDLPEIGDNLLGKITLFMTSRWSIDALGTVSNLEGMPYFAAGTFPQIEFVHSAEHLLACIASMGVLSLLCIIAVFILMRGIRKNG